LISRVGTRLTRTPHLIKATLVKGGKELTTGTIISLLGRVIGPSLGLGRLEVAFGLRANFNDSLNYS
jgi:hypothetical protein